MPLIHHYASKGDLERLAVELSKDNVDINIRMSKSGDTPLSYAAGYGQLEAVRLLLQARADIYVKDVCGFNPCQSALLKIFLGLHNREHGLISPCINVCKLLLAYEAREFRVFRSSGREGSLAGDVKKFKIDHEKYAVSSDLNKYLDDILDQKTWPSLLRSDGDSQYLDSVQDDLDQELSDKLLSLSLQPCVGLETSTPGMSLRSGKVKGGYTPQKDIDTPTSEESKSGMLLRSGTVKSEHSDQKIKRRVARTSSDKTSEDSLCTALLNCFIEAEKAETKDEGEPFLSKKPHKKNL